MVSVGLKYRSHIGLLKFVVLNYLDKGIAFVMPLLVLWLSDNKELYNDIEYVYSIANILVFVFSIVSFSSFYYYKESVDKGSFLRLYQKSSGIIMLLTVILTSVGMWIYKQFDAKITCALILCITSRTLYMVYINNVSSYVRLIDKPSKILLYSIFINLITIGVVYLCFLLSIRVLIPYFFVCFFVPFYYCILIIHENESVSGDLVKKFFIESLKYSWPIVVTCFIGAFVNNVGKLIAFNRMSVNDMYVFSYTLRISMIIQLAHSSIIAYFSKNIYLKGYPKKIIIAYLLLLLVAIFGCLLFIHLCNLSEKLYLPLNLTTFLIILYNFVFCCASFMELFFSRRKKNTNILIVTIISVLCFIALLSSLKIYSLRNIVICMLAYGIVRLVLYCLFILKIKKNENSNSVKCFS